MDKSDKTHQIISFLMNGAHYSINQEHFEDAVVNYPAAELRGI